MSVNAPSALMWRVKAALAETGIGGHLNQQELEELARAALDACRADELRVVLHCLLAAIGRLPVRILTGELSDTLLAADALLKSLPAPPTAPVAVRHPR